MKLSQCPNIDGSDCIFHGGGNDPCYPQPLAYCHSLSSTKGAMEHLLVYLWHFMSHREEGHSPLLLGGVWSSWWVWARYFVHCDTFSYLDMYSFRFFPRTAFCASGIPRTGEAYVLMHLSRTTVRVFLFQEMKTKKAILSNRVKLKEVNWKTSNK